MFQPLHHFQKSTPSGSWTVHSPSPLLSRNVRYNSITQPPSRVTRDCSKKKSKSSDPDDDNDFQPVTPPPHKTGPSWRREEIRRQRIVSEQHTRDELREGYRRLKDSLPVSFLNPDVHPIPPQTAPPASFTHPEMSVPMHRHQPLRRSTQILPAGASTHQRPNPCRCETPDSQGLQVLVDMLLRLVIRRHALGFP